MITKVLMPKLSEAMETGKVIKWLKKEGDAIKGGDVIAEIETDKANVEIEAFGAGVLRKIVIGEGGQVPVGEMIGVIADPADDIGAVAAAAPQPAAARRPRPPRRPPLPAMESYRSAPETNAVVPHGAGALCGARRRRRQDQGLAARPQGRRTVRRGSSPPPGHGARRPDRAAGRRVRRRVSGTCRRGRRRRRRAGALRRAPAVRRSPADGRRVRGQAAQLHARHHCQAHAARQRRPCRTSTSPRKSRWTARGRSAPS